MSSDWIINTGPSVALSKSHFVIAFELHDTISVELNLKKYKWAKLWSSNLRFEHLRAKIFKKRIISVIISPRSCFNAI